MFTSSVVWLEAIIYKTVWTPLNDKMLRVVLEITNEHDEYAVAITKGGCIVGHIPREISRICSLKVAIGLHYWVAMAVVNRLCSTCFIKVI